MREIAEYKEVISVQNTMRALRRLWWVPVILLLTAVGSAFVAGRLIKPKYEASATILVQTPTALQELSTGQNSAINNAVNIIKSREITRQTLARLGLELAVDSDEFAALYKSIEIELVPGSGTIHIKAHHLQPAMARDLVGTLIQSFVEQTRSYQAVAGEPLYEVSIIDAAYLPRRPINRVTNLSMLIAGGLALFVGCGLVILLEVFDSTIRQPDDIERQLGIPLLGIIPAVRRR